MVMPWLSDDTAGPGSEGPTGVPLLGNALPEGHAFQETMQLT